MAISQAKRGVSTNTLQLQLIKIFPEMHKKMSVTQGLLSDSKRMVYLKESEIHQWLWNAQRSKFNEFQQRRLEKTPDRLKRKQSMMVIKQSNNLTFKS